MYDLGFLWSMIYIDLLAVCFFKTLSVGIILSFFL